MSERSFEELVGIFAKKGLAGIMEAQGAKVPMPNIPKVSKKSSTHITTSIEEVGEETS